MDAKQINNNNIIFHLAENITALNGNKSKPSSKLSYKGVVVVIILLLYTVLSPIFKKIRFHYLHESGICMVIGSIVALISKYLFNMKDSFDNFLSFDEEIFFNLVLPPIIFSAGYNLKKRAFFNYFFYIVTFGIFGTLFCFGTIALFISLVNKSHLLEPFNLDIKTILLFSSVIASTDSVAALTFIKEDEQPKLFSVLFGEGVLNDAVCIVLYRVLLKIDFNQQEFNLGMILGVITKFLFLFLISCLIGSIGGLSCSFLLKLLKNFSLTRTQETSIIIFFAFLTYLITDLLDFSPIISLLFCGIFMSHYAFYNLSFQAREESSIVSKILSNIAEGFVFTYLGLSSVSIDYGNISVKFILFVFIFILLGRFISVYGICFIFNFLSKKTFDKIRGFFDFDVSEQSITFFAGCIRGAISFGLALSIPINNSNKNGNVNKAMIISSIIILVFCTTILFGALMSPIVTFFTKNQKRRNKSKKYLNNKKYGDYFEEELKRYSLQGYDGETLTLDDMNENEINDNNQQLDNNLFNKQPKDSKIKGLWQKIDQKLLRPIFNDNWPKVKEEHEEIVKEIMLVFERFSRKKLENSIRNNYHGPNLRKNSNSNSQQNK